MFFSYFHCQCLVLFTLVARNRIYTLPSLEVATATPETKLKSFRSKLFIHMRARRPRHRRLPVFIDNMTGRSLFTSQHLTALRALVLENACPVDENPGRAPSRHL